MLRRAGVSRNFLLAAPKHGRRIDRLEAIARELDWTLPELLGSAEAAATVDPGLNAHALRMAADLLRYRNDTPAREQLIATIAAAIYPWLVDRRSRGLPLLVGEEDAAWAALRLVLRNVLDLMHPNGQGASGRRRGG